MGQSIFRTTQDCSRVARGVLRVLLDHPAPAPSRPREDVTAILEDLTSELRAATPAASPGAELALTLLAFALAEQRPLNVLDVAAGDLNEQHRLAGDRIVSGDLCSRLLARRIPATQGPMQSSTYRSGYLAPQARSAAVRRFTEWMSRPGRSLGDLRELANGLARTFVANSVVIAPWPEVAAARMSFVVFRRVREALFAAGSGGAFQQYLLAGLLDSEAQQSAGTSRVETKSVGANDRAAKAVGDVQVRERQALVAAYEVSAAGWQTKLDQVSVAAQGGLTQITIVAGGVAGTPADEMAAAVEPAATREGIDIAVVDLTATTDVLAARLTPRGRVDAFRYVYDCLIRYHARNPALGERLINALESAGVVQVLEPGREPEDRDLLAAAGVATHIRGAIEASSELADVEPAELAAGLRALLAEVEAAPPAGTDP